MDFADYTENITFRFLQPNRPRPKGLRGLSMFLRKLGIHLEVLNTQLPCDQKETYQKLKAVCRVPRMSTYAVGAIINRAVADLPDGHAYVNVGVWNGYTFLSGLVGNSGRRCIGVDNFSHKNSPRREFLHRFAKFRGEGHTFHEMDYREYFQTLHQDPIGFYLFDGPHTYDDQLDGLKLAEPFFAKDCIVMVDDTNWDQVRQANLDFIAESPNDYRMLLDVQTPKSGHPTYWNGQMVFRLQGENVLKQSKSAAAAA